VNLHTCSNAYKLRENGYADGFVALTLCVVVLLPMSRRTRRWAGKRFLHILLLFGTMLFAFACVVAYQNWGYGGLIIGLIFAGIGVVPVAYVAALLRPVACARTLGVRNFCDVRHPLLWCVSPVESFVQRRLTRSDGRFAGTNRQLKE
jgi:hypothetical protein